MTLPVLTVVESAGWVASGSSSEPVLPVNDEVVEVLPVTDEVVEVLPVTDEVVEMLPVTGEVCATVVLGTLTVVVC